MLQKQNEKAITLIALVITIIVLLILAGVSIVTLSGENGILTMANKATLQNEAASVVEQIELKCSENNMIIALQTHNPDNVIKYEHLGFKLMEKVSSDEINLSCYNLLKY